MRFFKRFYPKKICKNVLEISYDFCKENGINAIILDIDNTLIDFDNNVLEGLENWVNSLKKQGICFCIVSNTNKKHKAEKMSKLLDIPFIYLATKPLKRGFVRAKTILKIDDSKKIAVIGDQVMTDVLGANRSGMISILVEPIKSKDIFVTKFNRKIEKIILNKYYNENNKIKKSN